MPYLSGEWNKKSEDSISMFTDQWVILVCPRKHYLLSDYCWHPGAPYTPNRIVYSCKASFNWTDKTFTLIRNWLTSRNKQHQGKKKIDNEYISKYRRPVRLCWQFSTITGRQGRLCRSTKSKFEFPRCCLLFTAEKHPIVWALEPWQVCWIVAVPANVTLWFSITSSPIVGWNEKGWRDPRSQHRFRLWGDDLKWVREDDKETGD